MMMEQKEKKPIQITIKHLFACKFISRRRPLPAAAVSQSRDGKKRRKFACHSNGRQWRRCRCSMRRFKISRSSEISIESILRETKNRRKTDANGNVVLIYISNGVSRHISRIDQFAFLNSLSASAVHAGVRVCV